MQDVLFKTDKPTATAGQVEFLELCLLQQDIAGQRVNFVREIRGWWDNETQRALLDEEKRLQSEPIRTYSEALERYCRRRLEYINGGFTHSFIWHPISGVPAFYKQLAPF
jgi:hypothetical protein